MASGYVAVQGGGSSNISEATTSAAGLMSAFDKEKLNGIANQANNYTHPSYTAVTGKPIENASPSFGGTFTVSQITTDSTGHVTDATDRTITIPNTTMTGATAETAGTSGLVPAPVAGSENRYLRADGNWETPPDTNTTYSVATKVSDGLLSASDKDKLDGIATGANAYTHPTHEAVTGKPTANATPGFGDTVTVSQIESDSLGHVVSATDRTITIPSTSASVNTKGIVQLSNSYDSSSETTAATSKALNDLRVLIFGVSDTSKISTSFDTLKEVADYLADHGSVVQGFTDDISALQKLAVNMTGATSTNDGKAGFVPAPASADRLKFLMGDGTWATPAGTYTHPSYTATTGAETGAQTVTLGNTVNVSQVTTDATGHVTGQTTRTIKFTHPTYTAQTGVATGNQAPAFGGTFNIDQFTSDGTGHISGRTTRTVTIPSSVATTEAAGLMSASDKTKLNGIADNANNYTYTHPSYTARTGKPTDAVSVTLGTAFTVSQITSDATGHVTGATDRSITVNHPSYTAQTGVASGNQTPNFGDTFNIDQFTSNATGHISGRTTRTVKIPDTAMTGATTSAAGTKGLVPAPEKGEATRYLRSDGTWQVPPNDNTVYTHPTQSAITGVPTGNVSPGFGGTFTVSQPTVNTLGHTTALTTRTITIPSATASTSANGLMSSTDKTNLTTLNTNRTNRMSPTTLSLPTSGWSTDSDSSGYKYYYDLTVSGMTAAKVCNVVISPASLPTAISCKLCPATESLAGKVRFRAKSAPSAAIAGTYWVES